jgi:hypothetical protein
MKFGQPGLGEQLVRVLGESELEQEETPRRAKLVRWPWTPGLGIGKVARDREGGLDMAARKRKTRSKKTRGRSGKSLVDSIQRQLKDLSREVDRRLRPIRKEIEKAERQGGREAARLLRQARARLNQVEVKGDSELSKFLRQRRRQLSMGIAQAERAVRPKRKKATRRKKA